MQAIYAEATRPVRADPSVVELASASRRSAVSATPRRAPEEQQPQPRVGAERRGEDAHLDCERAGERLAHRDGLTHLLASGRPSSADQRAVYCRCALG
jgi:hypothetical protein